MRCYTRGSIAFGVIIGLRWATAFAPHPTRTSTTAHKTDASSVPLTSSTQQAEIPPELERTAQHLEKLKSKSSFNQAKNGDELDVLGQERERIYQEYIQQAANALKIHLRDRGLPNKGRKPELARRLAQDDLDRLYGKQTKPQQDEDFIGDLGDRSTQGVSAEKEPSLVQFAGYPIGPQASQVLSNFNKPTKIQAAAMEHFLQNRNDPCILHAATGSGKTIAYLLPVVESIRRDGRGDSIVFILTPTRELGAQVASVAERLAPSPSLVQHVTHPTNLGSYQGARIYVGSAKCIYQSLYGKKKNDAPPTPKPLAMQLLADTTHLVIDEVDRLLLRQTQKHEKPAAILIAAITRLTLGKASLIAASATAGRPVRRELARCLGVPPSNGPQVVRVEPEVTIPSSITHYSVSVPVDASPGLVLTTAVGRVLRKIKDDQKVLLVLAKSFGLTAQHTVGALQHFGVEASLEALDGSVMVTTEDSIRGMDWDVDYVVLLGRPTGVPEYRHICGRTGRAGRSGSVVTVGDMQQWETMLGIEFQEWAL